MLFHLFNSLFIKNLHQYQHKKMPQSLITIMFDRLKEANIFLSVLFTLLSPTLIAQTATEYFVSNIKSFQSIANDDHFAPQSITLGSDEYIRFEFDLLSEDIQWLNYRLVHCNYDGSPSNLSELDYIDGFNDIQIEHYNPSFNTFTPYYHYSFTIPNYDVRPIISGRYRVEIFNNDTPDKVIAHSYFTVSEGILDIQGEVSTNTDIDFNEGHQQVNIKLITRNIAINNPASELKVVVTQNNRQDNQAIVTQPSSFNSNQIEYSHIRPLIFQAGNNYRRFEITDPQYAGLGVDIIRFYNNVYHCMLFPSEIRRYQPYTYDQDQDGRYFIRALRTEDSNLEADYMIVHFSIPLDYPFIEGDIHLQGDFLADNLGEESKMIYNFETKQYEKSLLLKQGLYNYLYLMVKHNEDKGSTLQIEGDKYQTPNEYLIDVYYHRPGERYDRLIGSKQIINQY